MNFAGLIFLLLAHYISGNGLLRLLCPGCKGVTATCISFILGVPIVSLAPCLLQLLGLEIAVWPAIIMVTVITAGLGIPAFKSFRKTGLQWPAMPKYYEWPFIAVCGFFMLVAAWRCFYYPPYARDMLAGPELLAEFAVREKTMVSSVFSIDLQSTNNYFKSPFVTSLQILYKLLVCPFGQVWLTFVAVPFLVWLYAILRSAIHPLIAGFLLLQFITISELYSYSYMVLYDYCNMVFFFGGFWFLTRYLKNDGKNDLVMAAVFFGIATYIRTETLFLFVFTSPILLIHFFRQKASLRKALTLGLLYLVIPVACYSLCNLVFVRLFVPVPFDISSMIQPDPGHLSFLAHRISDMFLYLIFSKKGINLFGYYIFFFCLLLLTDLLLFRKFNRECRVALYGIGLVFFGLALLGYLVPLVDLENTTKRGLFKFLPLMLIYMCSSQSMQYLSNLIFKWEVVNLSRKN